MRIKKIFFLITIFILTSLTVLWAEDKKTSRATKSVSTVNEYRELGRVRWLGDYHEALSRSKEEKKPVFVLIQDVSGSDANIKYGETVLSHPLVVEAIESLFIPVALHPRKSEKDDRFLEELDETSPNQTAIGILNSQGNDLTDRLRDNHTMDGILSVIVESLDHDIPEYVEILYVEHRLPKNTEKAVFPVHCFWSGEVELGPSHGILNTTPGKIGEKEAIEVVFDKDVTSYRKLLEESHSLGLCKDALYTTDEQRKVAEEMFGKKGVKKAGRFIPDRTPKYYLSQTKFESIPMTDRQAILVNSDLFFERDSKMRLSPRQIQMYDYIESDSNRVWRNLINKKDITSNWVRLSRRIHKLSKGKVDIH